MADAAGIDALTVAAVQMTSGPDPVANMDAAAVLIEQAASDGAQLVVLPENFGFMGARDSERTAHAEADGDGPMQAFLSERAAAAEVWLVGGTLPILAEDGRANSSCLVYDADGIRRGRYDKIHLFDVDVPGGDERYRESDRTAPGRTPVMVDTPWGGLALAICYDLRFPELLRQLAGDDLSLIAVPTAFTVPTGRAHWSLLARTRAVENLCPLVAACQAGTHPSGRETWGHSMVIDAWGEVLAELERSPGVALARLDLRRTRELRAGFPVLSHRML